MICSSFQAEKSFKSCHTKDTYFTIRGSRDSYSLFTCPTTNCESLRIKILSADIVAASSILASMTSYSDSLLEAPKPKRMACLIKDKTSNSDHLLSSKSKRKRVGEKGNLQSLGFLFSSERVSDFSLKSWAIGPSDSFEPRSKAILRSEGFVWVPVLGSFDKLRKVEVLSYLSYTLFKCFVDDSVNLRP